MSKGEGMQDEERKKSRRSALLQGFKAGIPIGLGYFAVSFSLGIAARNAGMTAFQGFFMSFFMNASAGEYAGINAIRDSVGILTTILVTLVANARYMLMSCALSQRMDPKLGLGHRLLVGFYLTDELFGIAIARPGFIDPYYTYGAALFAGPCWAVGTAVGILVGNLLPESVVSALSVALYGMFLSIIIPPARKNKVVAGLVLLSFALSFMFSRVPFLATMNESLRIILLTVGLSALAALLFPRKDEEEETPDEGTSDKDMSDQDTEKQEEGKA